ncbi:rRNA pseudouridine synthase [Chitinophagales bacterium]|nr:rRNA pseudouridine synthase [Chitinophagales bacterium]
MLKEKFLKKRLYQLHVPEEGIRLNKYVANSGVAARRKADELISDGKVTVNDVVIREMGHRVMKGDLVRHMGKLLVPGKKTYVLLNKPKDVITTTDDDRGRRTVMDCISRVNAERVYPIGRLDRNTTGLLLFTNDGDLAQLLSHPSSEVKKLYHVTLDRSITANHMEAIRGGTVILEEGPVPVDELDYVEDAPKSQVGISLHVGWNRVVRRTFEKLGYQVKYLDRVIYAQLTKKDLPRGKWRYLSQKEVIRLKHLGKGK